MIRRLVFASTAVALVLTTPAFAQPYGEPDPYTLPPGYNQVTGYDDPDQYAAPDAEPGYAPEYEGPAYYDAPPAEDYADDRSGYVQDDRYAEPPVYADDRGYQADYDAARGRDDSYYNSGASVRGSSTYSRDSYSRSGETYSSRERSTSAEAYVEGEIEYDADGRVIRHDRAYTGSPVYVDERGVSREGEVYRGQGYDDRYETGGRYEAERSGYSARYESAPFGYQRRFYAFSVAAEESEEVEVRRSEEYAYRRDEIAAWARGDLHLDSSFVTSLTGGVEGQGPVMWSEGGGYASFSASASSFAGARAFAFAGARGRGHRGKGRRGHGCGC